MRPAPGLGGPAPGRGGVCIPACTEADTPLPPQTSTAAGGTHPTGKECWLEVIIQKKLQLTQLEMAPWLLVDSTQMMMICMEVSCLFFNESLTETQIMQLQ